MTEERKFYEKHRGKEVMVEGRKESVIGFDNNDNEYNTPILITDSLEREDSFGEVLEIFENIEVFRVINTRDMVAWSSMEKLTPIEEDQPIEEVKRFKEGDKVRVVKQVHGHKFKINEIVTINEVRLGNYKAIDIYGDLWAIEDEELEYVKHKELTKEYLQVGNYSDKSIKKRLEDRLDEYYKQYMNPHCEPIDKFDPQIPESILNALERIK